MPDVFLSYARPDSAVARRLTDELEARGLTVFSDFALVAGEDFSHSIEKALSSSRAVVVLLSRQSSRGQWVEAQIREALESQRLIIPVLLGDDATENWVWPLISDRVALRVDPNGSFHQVVEEIMKVFDPPRPAARRTWRASWLTLIVALLSGLLGAVVSWLAKR